MHVILCTVRLLACHLSSALYFYCCLQCLSHLLVPQRAAELVGVATDTSVHMYSQWMIHDYPIPMFSNKHTVLTVPASQMSEFAIDMAIEQTHMVVNRQTTNVQQNIKTELCRLCRSV